MHSLHISFYLMRSLESSERSHREEGKQAFAKVSIPVVPPPSIISFPCNCMVILLDFQTWVCHEIDFLGQKP